MESFSFAKTELFLPFRLGRTARETLQEFIDIDVTAEDLSRILNENQAYRDLFFRFVSQKTAKAEKPNEGEKAENAPPSPTHRLVSLLGMLGARNLVVALPLHRLTDGRFPLTDEGKLELTATETVKWALEAEDLFLRNKLEYSETAYAAGVYFDLCRRLYGKDGGLKKLEPYYKRTWARALRTGLVAYFLADKLAGFTPKYALAAGMLTHGGKLHLASMFDGYAEREESLDTNNEIPPLGRVLLEREAFPVLAEEVGSHTLRYFDVFKLLAPAVRYYREPYVLKGADEHNYKLAVLLWLADSMARSWKVPLDEKDPVFNDWTYPGLGTLKIRRTLLIEVMKRAMTMK